MTVGFDYDLRLLHFVVLNAVVLFAAWQFVRRMGIDDPIAALLDSSLVWILVQYASVGLTGLAGVLSSATITAAAILLCVAAIGFALVRSGARPPPLTLTRDFTAPALPIACLLFVIGYVAAIIFHQRSAAVMSIDAMAYHLPAAVQWLQEHRISLYQTWFYTNPANAFSPLGGSIIDVWWIAPMGNDVLVRFVQAPALIIIALAVVQICRSLGTGVNVACLIATLAVMCRPFVSQIDIPKDDLYAAGFFAMAVAALAPQRLKDRFGPWRLGASVGLLLATKYTTLMALPVLMLGLDAPWRARWSWRRWTIALAAILLLAGPWFLRNFLLTGNPIFPIQTPLFDGMFRMSRSTRLARPAAGLWYVLTQTYHSFSSPLAVGVLAAWLAGAAVSARRALRDPVVRVTMIGPLVGLLIFVFTSPYPEIRFLYPELLLMFCAIAPLAVMVPDSMAGTVLAGTALLAAGSVFIGGTGIGFAAVGLVVAAIGAGLATLRRIPARYRVGVPLGALALAVGLLAYVDWTSYVRNYREFTNFFWKPYGPVAQVWQTVRQDLPADAVLAYTNTYLTYPLYGFDLSRRVTYVPTRRGVDDFLDLPPLPRTATDENLRRQVEEITFDDPDADEWLARLKSRQVTHLLIVKPDPSDLFVTATPPELDIVARHPETFDLLYDSPAASMFSVRFPPSGAN